MFQKQSADYLRGEYVPKIDLAIAPLTLDQLWWRPNEASNSIGNLMLHLEGNVRQWISGGVAGQEVVRDRPSEFSTRAHLPAAELLKRLKGTVSEAARIIEHLSDAQLAEARSIQGFETTVFGAVYHVVEHFAMHTGQIILLAKAQTGADAGFYRIRPDGTPEPVFTNRRAFAKE
jgi:uncharacterized damage-inducible protein DinB